MKFDAANSEGKIDKNERIKFTGWSEFNDWMKMNVMNNPTKQIKLKWIKAGAAGCGLLIAGLFLISEFIWLTANQIHSEIKPANKPTSSSSSH